MLIKMIDTAVKTATVTLNYDDLRCLNNSLYLLSQQQGKKDVDFNNVYSNILFLSMLVKEGELPTYALDHISSLRHDGDTDGSNK